MCWGWFERAEMPFGSSHGEDTVPHTQSQQILTLCPTISVQGYNNGMETKYQ